MAAIGPSGKRRHNRGSHRGGNFVGRAQQPGRSSSDKECGLMAQKKAAEPIAPRAKLEIEFQEPHLLGPLFGEFDRHLVAIEDRLGVYIADQDESRFGHEGVSTCRSRWSLYT